MKQVVPMAQVNRRLPVMGRLRFGKRTTSKNGKEMPVAIDTWIFTSSDQAALEVVAVKYGGDIEPFEKGAAGTYKVETQANSVRVVLPPDCLADSFYELWAGRGLQRKCDGITCTGFPDDGDPVEVPCVCVRSGLISCSPKTRLSVIIPEVGLGGVWRLDTSSQAALEELPASVELIRAASTVGFPEGVLSLQHRESQGGRRRFIVPMLSSSASFDQLAAGVSATAAIAAPLDDYVALAEVVEDDEWT